MKQNKLLESFQGTKFRHGGYASLMIVAAIAIVVVLNLFVDQIPLKVDLTQNKLFTLSSQTTQMLSSLASDVTITQLSKVGQEDPLVNGILQKYALANKHVKLQTIDPDRNPGFAKKYDTTGTGLTEGTLVIVGPKRFKTVGRYDMYNVDYSDPSQQPQVTSESVELRVTSAIQYVTVDTNPILYAIQGHGEPTISSLQLTGPIQNENYEQKDLTLLTSTSVPADASMLVEVAPTSDFTTQDTDKVRTYLENGGRAMFLLGPRQERTSFPNIEGLLKSYGVSIQDVLVVEGDTNHMVPGNPVWLLPTLESHEILNPLSESNLRVFTPVSQAVTTLTLKKQTVTVSPLLSSTANSWGKVDYTNATTLDKENGDVEGPFTLAVAIQDQPESSTAKDTRIVVVASSQFLQPDAVSLAPGNSDFFLNSLSWLRESKDTISIQPKSLQAFRLQINETQTLVLSALVAIVVPLLILGAGLAVWMRRRHL